MPKINLTDFLSLNRTKQNKMIINQINLRIEETDNTSVFEYHFLKSLNEARTPIVKTTIIQEDKKEHSKEEAQPEDPRIFNAKFECYLSSHSEDLEVRARLLAKVIESGNITDDNLAKIMRQSRDNLDSIINQLDAPNKIIILNKVLNISKNLDSLRKYNLTDFQFTSFVNTQSDYDLTRSHGNKIKEGSGTIDQKLIDLQIDAKELSSINNKTLEDVLIKSFVEISERFVLAIDTSNDVIQDQKAALSKKMYEIISLQNKEESKNKGFFTRVRNSIPTTKRKTSSEKTDAIELVKKMNDTIQLIQELTQQIKDSKSAIQEIAKQNPQLDNVTQEQINNIADITAKINEARLIHISSVKTALLKKLINIDQKELTENTDPLEILDSLKFIIKNNSDSESLEQTSIELTSYLKMISRFKNTLPNEVEILDLLLTHMSKIPESYFITIESKEESEAIEGDSEDILNKCDIGLIFQKIMSTNSDLLITKLTRKIMKD